ncbi:hypothetical protein BH23CHL2_BH23CHL2_18020 [soil metagenome]
MRSTTTDRLGVPAMTVSAEARTPEELETLFEDSLMIRDREALAGLFDEGAVLVPGGARPARGRDEIVRLILSSWGSERIYVADPQSVTQARGMALIIGGHTISVARRGHDGSWRYAIFVLFIENDVERLEE